MAKKEGASRSEEPSKIPVAFLVLGYENNRNTIIDFYRNANTMVNWVTDESLLELQSKLSWLESEVAAARSRGVKCNNITDITENNLLHCKKLMTKVDELRHLDGIRVDFGIADTEALSMILPSSSSLTPTVEQDIQFIQSNSESVVRYKQLLFDMLWTKATPGQRRIDELERKSKVSSVIKERAIEQSEVTRRNAIDRIYVCNDYHNMFIFPQEMEDPMKTEGHGSFREYPLVG
jgi:hypothetical protein